MILRIQRTITEVSHRWESLMLSNFPLQKRWVKGSCFFFFLHFFFLWARETPGACIFPGSIAQSSYQKCLLLLQPSFSWQLWRQASQFVSFPECSWSACQALALVWCAESAQCGLWSGQDFVIRRRSFEPLPTKKKIPVHGHILPALPIFQELPQVPLVAVCQRALALPGFEPFFTLVGGPRKHEQCLCCTTPVLSVGSVGWVST